MIQRRIAVLALSALLLSACASAPVPSDYAAEKPALDLRSYFNGPLLAHGIFTDRAGKVQRRFTVKLMGRWNGDEGTLEEDFDYSDGKKERRVWTIKHLGNGRYTGTAADVVGTAQGEAAGNALRWSYTLKLPVGDKVYDIDFEDWMYLMDSRVMLNKAQMSKFGFKVGEVTLSFEKL